MIRLLQIWDDWPLQNDSVQICFDSQDALRREFEKNIVNRGIFVATEAEFEIRQTIEVNIVLSYIDDDHCVLTLRGEIVHCIPIAMAASGATPGIAIEFELIARDLREAFQPLLEQSSSPAQLPDLEPGIEPPRVEEEVKDGSERRGAKRGPVRVPVRIMPTMSPPFEATSRDLSSTGILLTVKSVALPIGEVVRTCLWHPSGNPSIEIDGEVVRQVRNKSGRVAAVAIAFDRDQAAEPRVHELIDALRHAGHRSQLGGIRGSIVDLGLANMLQMFGSSAPKGTLVVDRDGEQGWVAFANGQLLAAELGERSGQDALVAMLEWGDGRFQFEATADENLIRNAERRPLEAAVFEAVCAIDELNRSGDDHDNHDESFQAAEAPRDRTTIGDATTYSIDIVQEDISRSLFDKTEEAVLELAKSGMSTEKLESIIPEPADSVHAALENLVEMGVLLPR